MEEPRKGPGGMQLEESREIKCGRGPDEYPRAGGEIGRSKNNGKIDDRRILGLRRGRRERETNVRSRREVEIRREEGSRPDRLG